MQYKFLKFLKDNINNKARQVFITTHSTHITSAVSLDEIICLSYLEDELHIGYPGKVFPNNEDGKKSKAFVQRFLDATRSDMLFAKNVILVEGLAEQLLMATFAKYHNKPLEDGHVTVINIGGRYFDHFLKLFDTTQPYTISKKVACITDCDPSFKEITPTDSKSKKCYPFETGADTAKYTYDNHASSYIFQYKNHPSTRFFSQDALRGKTLEYDLLLCNPCCELLLTDLIDNKAEIKSMMGAYQRNDDLTKIESDGYIRTTTENTRILNGLKAVKGKWSNEEVVASLIASRYLNSVGKGENALELSVVLEQNLNADPASIFIVPQYLKKAIDWVCL